jgi:hypothetical protein
MNNRNRIDGISEIKGSNGKKMKNNTLNNFLSNNKSSGYYGLHSTECDLKC